MLKYGALIDGVAPLTEGPGFRVNAYVWQAEVNSPGYSSSGKTEEIMLLDLFVKGLRIKNGLIHLPAMSGRQTSFPVVFLPRPFADAIVEAVLGHEKLRERFPDCFPLMRADILAEGLMFPVKDLIRDYPALARQRGLTTE